MKRIGAGGPASRAADSEEALIARLTTLARALDGEPDPDWQARTRGRLVAMAAVRTPEPEPVSPVRRMLARSEGRPGIWRTRLIAGLAGAAAAVTGVAAAVTLSADATPGDALYGFKRGAEQTQLALAGDARGRTLLAFASTRLEELAVVLTDDPSADLVADTLATMDAQTADGVAWLSRRALDTGSSAQLDEVSGWTAGQSADLGDVRSGVPAAAQDDAADSVDLLARIDERMDALQVALDCPAGPATDGSDALGPVPGTCTAPEPADGAGAPGGSDTARPGTTAAPTPGRSADPTTAPGSGTDGSGGSRSGAGSDPASDSGTGSDSGSSSGPNPGSGSQSGPDSGSDGSDLPELPEVDPSTPDLPDPSLPTLVPEPEGTVRVPLPGTAEGSSPSPVPLPDLDVCVPDLPVIGDC